MLDDLIAEGERIKGSAKSGQFGPYLSGEEYAVWINKCILFLEKNYEDSTMTERFIEASKNANGHGVHPHFDNMMGVLKALKDMGSHE